MKAEMFYHLSFIAKSAVGNHNKKASMMFLSRELASKDHQLKSQMAVSFQDDDNFKNTEKIWLESGFFWSFKSQLS